MRKWRFEFYDYDLQQAVALKHDIDEWKAFGISYGREQKTSILKSYSAQFTFIKEDADYLKNVIKTRGLSARIGLNVWLSGKVDGQDVRYYSCRLELFDCSIERNMFTCSIYDGNFFALLDNAWSVKHEFSNRIKVPPYTLNGVTYLGISFPDTDFKDINFKGGSYKYEKLLSVNADKLELSKAFGMQGASVAGEENQLRNKANFLPVTNTGGDSKLKFFADAVNVNVLDNAADVSQKQMFVISESRMNAGQIDINGSIGRVECMYQGNQLDMSGNTEYQCKLRIVFYLCIFDNFATADGEKWRPSQHSLLAVNNTGIAATSAVEIPMTAVGILNDDNQQALVFFQDGGHYPSTADTKLHFSNISFDVSWLKNFRQGHGGYYLGLCCTINSYYYDNGNWQLIGNGAEVNSYKNAYNISMKYDEFAINPYERTIHAIKPSVLFKKMVEKINGKGKRYDENGIYVGDYNGDYNLDIDLKALEDAEGGLVLFGDKMARGSVDDIEASMTTSIEDLTRFIYVNLALKLCCTYDRQYDIYNVFFRHVYDCYSEDVSVELKDVRGVKVSAYNDCLYTHVEVGYKNLEESILGYKEYNTCNVFSTEHKEKEEHRKDLYSNYKGGCFDVETIVYEMKDTEDTNVNSDNVFMLETENGESKLYSVGYDDYSKCLNVGFTPKGILDRHFREFAGINTLKFVSSERVADFKFVMLDESADVDISGVTKLFAPFLIEVESGAYLQMLEDMEQNPFGLVGFKLGNVHFYGYIAEGTDSVQVNPMNEKASSFSLICKVIPF